MRPCFFSLTVLLSTIVLFSFKSKADVDQKIVIGSIERDMSGEIIYQNQQGAIDHCAKKLMRLPTARELGQDARSFGVVGVTSDPVVGSYTIKSTDLTGMEEQFYFSAKGYLQPTDDNGHTHVWSSSYFTDYSSYAYYFDGYKGTLQYQDRFNIIKAIRCVEN